VTDKRRQQPFVTGLDWESPSHLGTNWRGVDGRVTLVTGRPSPTSKCRDDDERQLSRLEFPCFIRHTLLLLLLLGAVPADIVWSW